MTRKLMAYLPWLFDFDSIVIPPIAQENKYLGGYYREIFLFYHEYVCCMHLLESPYRGDSNEITQHTISV